MLSLSLSLFLALSRSLSLSLFLSLSRSLALSLSLTQTQSPVSRDAEHSHNALESIILSQTVCSSLSSSEILLSRDSLAKTADSAKGSHDPTEVDIKLSSASIRHVHDNYG